MKIWIFFLLIAMVLLQACSIQDNDFPGGETSCESHTTVASSESSEMTSAKEIDTTSSDKTQSTAVTSQSKTKSQPTKTTASSKKSSVVTSQSKTKSRPAENVEEYTETILWEQNTDGIELFHVFGLTSVGKTVLAFAEARYGTGDCGCPHDIWMKRSTDGGRTFGKSVCIVPSNNTHCFTNPVPLYDETAKRLFLFYSENFDNMYTENYLITSDDLGLTWSESQSFTELFNSVASPLPFHLAGPGHGLQLKEGPKAGRLIIPIWHRYGVNKKKEQRNYCVSMLYSDDHGKMWKQTAMNTGVAEFANESRIVETNNGLWWTFRPLNTARYCLRSRDYGMTWTTSQEMPITQAVNCDAGAISLLGVSGFENCVLLSRVSNESERRDMEILISFDNGATFTKKLELTKGNAHPGYSDLCVITDSSQSVVGLLHCRGKKVLFSRLSVQSLTQ